MPNTSVFTASRYNEGQIVLTRVPLKNASIRVKRFTEVKIVEKAVSGGYTVMVDEGLRLGEVYDEFLILPEEKQPIQSAFVFKIAFLITWLALLNLIIQIASR